VATKQACHDFARGGSDCIIRGTKNLSQAHVPASRGAMAGHGLLLANTPTRDSQTT